MLWLLQLLDRVGWLRGLVGWWVWEGGLLLCVAVVAAAVASSSSWEQIKKDGALPGRRVYAQKDSKGKKREGAV